MVLESPFCVGGYNPYPDDFAPAFGGRGAPIPDSGLNWYGALAFAAWGWGCGLELALGARPVSFRGVDWYAAWGFVLAACLPGGCGLAFGAAPISSSGLNAYGAFGFGIVAFCGLIYCSAAGAGAGLIAPSSLLVVGR